MVISWYNIYKLIFTTLLAAASMACVKDDTGHVPGPENGKVRLRIVTDGSDYSLPVTRTDENTIGPPMVLVYTGEDESAVFSEAVQSEDDGTGTVVTLKVSDDKSIFVVIANAPAKFRDSTDGTEYDFTESALNTLLAGTRVNELDKLVRTLQLDVPQVILPYLDINGKLPMSGLSYPVPKIEEGTVIQNTGTGKMMLTRAIAKATVQVDPSLTNFIFTGAGVLGANCDGALYRSDDGNTHTGDNHISLAAKRTNYLPAGQNDVVTSAGTTINPFYLYESSRRESDPTAVIIKAQLNGTTYYYKLGFVIDGEVINILRNRNYTFTVSSAGPGYPTLGEAWEGPVSNIEYTIEVTDATGHDIIGNGQYYLALSNSEVINYGTRNTFSDAFVVSTDCAPEWAVEGIILTPSAGITITSPSGGKVPLASSGVTSAAVNFTVAADTYAGTIEVRIGNLTQTVVYRRLASVYYSGHRALPYNNYVQCDVPAGTADWLKLKGEDNMRFTGSMTFRHAQRLSIDADRYITEDGSRETVFFASRQSGGRAKIYVTQQGIDIKTITHVAEEGFYVGAFWRASQSGERLIRIPFNSNIYGDWTATVVEGDDWIKIDQNPSSDPGVTWVEGAESPADMMLLDASYQVPGNGQSAGGTLEGPGEEIFFRIGLTGTIPEGSQPRYGTILMSYNMYTQANGVPNTKYCYLYIRQGEEPDYLMRPEDPNSTGGGYGDGTTHRPRAVKFSPFNLTAQAYKDNPYHIPTSAAGVSVAAHPQVDRGVFVDYPTQAGAFFTWATAITAPNNTYKRAWHPIFPQGAAVVNWPGLGSYPDYPDVHSNKRWPEIRDEQETCPQGYRRLRDWYDDATSVANNTNVPIADSEIRQSLFLSPVTTQNAISTINFYVGYYADGYFDRRAIHTETSSNIPTHAVASDGALVGYRGMLFYNRYNNASLFFPYTGMRTTVSGNLDQPGRQSQYWVSSTQGGTTAWYIRMTESQSLTNGGGTQMQASGQRYSANALRCVLDD